MAQVTGTLFSPSYVLKCDGAPLAFVVLEQALMDFNLGRSISAAQVSGTFPALYSGQKKGPKTPRSAANGTGKGGKKGC